MSKLLGEIGRGYARGGIIYFASTVIMLSLMCVLICLPLWLITRIGCPGVDSLSNRRDVACNFVWKHSCGIDRKLSGSKETFGQGVSSLGLGR